VVLSIASITPAAQDRSSGRSAFARDALGRQHRSGCQQIAARLRGSHQRMSEVLLNRLDAPVCARALLEERIGAIREVARGGSPSMRTLSNARRSWRSTTLANLTRNGRDACPDRYVGCMGRGPPSARD